MGALPTIGFVLCIIATTGILFSTIHNEWKRNSQIDSQGNLNRIYRCEGLWVQCTSPLVGQFQCDTFETALLGLPAQLLAMRGMMVTACLFSIISIATMGVGLDCNSAVNGKQKSIARKVAGALMVLAAALQCQRAFMVVAGLFAVCGLVAGTVGQSCVHALEGKPKLYSARSGGILMLIAGALTLTSVSWYAAEVVREYWKDQMLDSAFQYEFGAALYIGWISSGLALLSGFLMAFCSAVEDEVEYGHNYTYSPHKQQPMPKSGHNTEYV